MIFDKLLRRNSQENTVQGQFVCLQCDKHYGPERKTCPVDGGLIVHKDEKVRGDGLVGRLFVDRYSMGAILGEGGMSVVYKAHHTMMDRQVAIKILKNFESSQDKMLQRFQQEARAASSLNHGNLITLHDFGISSEGYAYIVMDYLEGQSLEALLEADGPIEYQRAAKLFLQVCDGLDHAHSKGIVHRDIKPSNIVMLHAGTSEEQVKIVDFGIAKLLPEANKETFGLTQAGQIFGSPLFMSPEQCLNRKVDSRTDIYAVGATMYSALTGRPPFEAPTLAEVIYAHLKTEPQSLSVLAPAMKIPERLEQVVLKCLEKNSEDRFQSMAELKAEIEAAIGAKKKATEVKQTLINVVLAEDSDDLAQKITENIAVAGGMALLARAKSGDEAIDKTMQYIPQVVLVDVKLPGLDGVEVTKQLKACSPNIRVLLYTIADDYSALIASLNSGADGFILKDMSPSRLGQAIKSIVNGIAWIDPEITSRVLRQSAHRFSKTSLDVSTKAASNESLDHAGFLETLANIYVQEKKYDEAEALFHGCIALQEKARGKDTPELCSSLTKLADLYMSRQKTAAAEHMYMRALQVRFQTLGQEHLDVAASLESLGQLFQISGGFSEAERFYLWALRIRQKVNDRADESMTALASNYQKLGILFRQLKRENEAAEMERFAQHVREDMLSSTRLGD
jgi:DNA-binding NarL/FixJ family response regulator/tRNA A-37 threonylcarbamoyl transferase component Bud32